MSKYLRWVGWQFDLLLFWPTRFGREVYGDRSGDVRMPRKRRFIYMLKLLPWITLLAVLGNLLVGAIMDHYGGYKWGESWVGVAFPLSFYLVSEAGDQRGLTSAATGALKWLREHDVLDDAGKFVVPMMERWMRENAG